MMRDKCFSYQELKAIKVEECLQPLVDLTLDSEVLSVGPTPEKLKPYISSGMWVRREVREKLLLAQSYLASRIPKTKIYVRYGYRHPEVQKKYFQDFYKKSKLQFPELSEQELLEYVHHYMAIPEVGGHPAGAAVDITLVSSNTAEELDMGSKIADFSDMDLIRPICSKLTASQQKLRIDLRESMIEAGFAPYDFEWWHFSYGDREWACYYQKEKAIYSEIDFRL